MTGIITDNIGRSSGVKIAVAGGGGKIGQVITSTSDYGNSASATSYADVLSSSGTTWETAITPAATSSKILITATLGFNITGSSSDNNRALAKMAGQIGAGSYADLIGYARMGVYDYAGYSSTSGTVTFLLLWSPSTTSECTIKFQYASSDTGGTVHTPITSPQANVVVLQEVLA
tara:strand:+ start:298 stop:822 length:525 start_codon:yes stop_codon:yes gene_type:complete